MQQTAPGGAPMNFNAFKDSFSQGVSFLKRRFSSSDLQQDVDDDMAAQQQQLQQGQQEAGYPTPQGTAAGGVGPAGGQRQPQQHGPQSRVGQPPPPPPNRLDFSVQGMANRMSSTISAPTSPAKSSYGGSSGGGVGSVIGSVSSGGGGGAAAMVQGITRNILQAASQKTSSVLASASSSSSRCKCLLVIDNQPVDWSKYFRGKKILGDWDIRVEQVEFSKIQLASTSDGSCVLEIEGGRSIKPDFALIRQPARVGASDWSPIVIGLLYGGVPSLNSLHSVYNYTDRPWVFAHLLMIHRRLGADKFPLIDQVYYLGNRQLPSANTSAAYPIVAKMGHSQGGAGKVKINDPHQLADIASVASLYPHDYCTIEPYIDAKYDIHVQKIGANYKVFLRKGISGYWKTNQGSAMLEQVAITDRYKMWIEEVALMFGGLDICCVDAVVGKDGRELIIEANDSTFTLIGETQEEDRRHIAELVMQKMNHILGVKHALQRKESMGSAAPQNFIRHESPSTQGGRPQPPPPLPPGHPGAPPPGGDAHGGGGVPPRPRPPPPQPGGHGPLPPGVQGAPGGQPPMLPRQQSQPVRDEQQAPQQSAPSGNPADDTMSNLKKTFAGIFGDM